MKKNNSSKSCKAKKTFLEAICEGFVMSLFAQYGVSAPESKCLQDEKNIKTSLKYPSIVLY
jgi:hypothetical protein